MFGFKVLCNSVAASVFIVFQGMCFGSVQNEHPGLEAYTPTETQWEKWQIDSAKNVHQEPRKSSRQSSDEGEVFIFRKQRFNESMENIQTVDSGALMKSTYIPIIQDQVNVNEEFNQSSVPTFQRNMRVKEIVRGDNKTSWTKENFVVKDGKKYRIVKVKKATKHLHNDQPTNGIRRSFKLFSNLLDVLPFKWMTREKKNATESRKKSENTTERSTVAPPHNSEDNSTEIHKYHVSSEKVKKLLNLFSIVKFENGECYANGVKGTCLHQMECEAKGGKFAATCAEQLGVCCYIEKTCGETSNSNCTYFINEGFPDSSAAAPKVCTLALEKTSSDVKQLRLDFQLFQLREPTNGTCLQDRLVISGQNINDVVPDICGTNTGQHVYIDVGESNGPFSLNIITVGEYFPRNFRIKVTQIVEEDPQLAPKNCLQYYTEPTGYVQTFNYQQVEFENADTVTSGYFNNLNYAVCIKKVRGFCSITYENEEADSILPTFELVNVDEDGERLLPPHQAGAETFDCPDDYIIVNGIRLCGERLNDASVEIDYTKNYPVTDVSNGPFVLSVRTDGAVNGRGFHLKYTQNLCLI